MIVSVDSPPTTPRCTLNNLLRSVISPIAPCSGGGVVGAVNDDVQQEPSSFALSSPPRTPRVRMTPTRSGFLNPVTPSSIDDSFAATASASSSSAQKKQMALHKSPDTIKLRLPGYSSTKRLPRPISLFHTPPRSSTFRALRSNSNNNNNRNNSPEAEAALLGKPKTKTEEKPIMIPWISKFFENMEYCDSCSLMDNSATTAWADNRAPWAVRLTEDALQQHDQTSPFSVSRHSTHGAPHFEGDSLAKMVIRKKAQHELAKERRQRAKMELSDLQQSLTIEEEDQIEAVLQQHQREWIQQEREKALSAKWQRKKNEQKDRMRVEQMRWTELERQRGLRAAEIRGQQRATTSSSQRQRQRPQGAKEPPEMIKKASPEKSKRSRGSRMVSPQPDEDMTPKTHQSVSSSSNLIYI